VPEIEFPCSQDSEAGEIDPFSRVGKTNANHETIKRQAFQNHRNSGKSSAEAELGSLADCSKKRSSL
jgi:hypothetical protein